MVFFNIHRLCDILKRELMLNSRIIKFVYTLIIFCFDYSKAAWSHCGMSYFMNDHQIVGFCTLILIIYLLHEYDVQNMFTIIKWEVIKRTKCALASHKNLPRCLGGYVCERNGALIGKSNPLYNEENLRVCMWIKSMKINPWLINQSYQNMKSNRLFC